MYVLLDSYTTFDLLEGKDIISFGHFCLQGQELCLSSVNTE